MAHPSPGSRDVDQGGFETEAQILVQPHAQVGFALRLLELLKNTHFSAVVGPLADHARRAPAELAVAGIAKAQRGKDRLGDVGIAPVAGWQR